LSQVTKEIATEPERQNSSKKPSLESYALAEQIANEEISGGKSSTLKQYYINLMTQLEIEGFPKQQISTIGKQIVIEKKSEKLKDIPKEEISIGSWWYDVTKERGCIDPHYSHPDEPKDLAPPTFFELQNQQTISVIDEMMEFLKSEKQFLKHNEHDSKIHENTLRENILILRKAVTHANERFNKKRKIAPSHYSILFRDFIYSMSSYLSVPYYLHVRKKETFTAKQAGKVIKATIKDIPYRFEPIDEDEAEACGFSGVPCPNCGNFRTELH